MTGSHTRGTRHRASDDKTDDLPVRLLSPGATRSRIGLVGWQVDTEMTEARIVERLDRCAGIIQDCCHSQLAEAQHQTESQ